MKHSDHLCCSRLMWLALLCGFALPAATHAADQDRARQGVVSGVYKPLTAIIADMGQRYPGRVVDVESKPDARGELRYEITLIDPQGRKQQLLLDARTGQVIAHEQDLAHHAVRMAELAAYLRRVEQQQESRVIEAEFEVTHQGQPIYKLKLEPQGKATRHMLIDARTGSAIGKAAAPGSAAAAPLKTMPEMLDALNARFSGLVMEVELENAQTPDAHYEIELLQNDGSKLELRVDARTLTIR